MSNKILENIAKDVLDKLLENMPEDILNKK